LLRVNREIKMSIRCIVACFLCCIVNIGQAQDTCNITGSITAADTSGTILSLPFAQVLILNPTDSSIISYAISGKNGTYAVKVSCGQKHLIKVSLMGYKASFQLIEMKDNLFQSFLLEAQTFELGEVQIHGDRPMKTTGDTTAFSVNYFRSGEEQTVEDVLKKLPGIDVSESGEIKYQNKPITRVLLDGDDLTGNNYRLLTQNLSAELLGKVEVVKNYTDESILRGISETDDIAVNLQLKENRKAPVFGNLTGRSDFFSRYGVSTNLLSYKGAFKAVLIGEINNLGNNPSFFDEYRGGLDAGEPEFDAASLVGEIISSEILRSSDYTRNNSQYLSLNMVNRGEKLKFNNHISLADLEQRLSKFTYTKFFDEDSQELERMEFFTKETKLFSDKLNLEYQVSERKKFTYQGAFLLGKDDRDGNLNVNDKLLKDNLAGTTFQVANRVQYAQRFEGKSALILNMTHQRKEVEQQYDVSDNGLFPVTSRDSELNQLYKSPYDLLDASIKFVRKTIRWNLSLTGTFRYQDQKLSNRISATETLFDEQLRVRSVGWDLSPIIKYKFKNTVIGLRPGVKVFRNRIEYAGTEWITLLNPSLSIRRRLTSALKLDLYLQKNANVAELNTLFRNPQITSYYSTTQSDLVPFTKFSDFSMIANLSGESTSRLSTYFLSLLWLNQVNGINFQYEVSENSVSTVQRSGDGPRSFSLSAGFDTYITPISSTLKLSTSYNRSLVPLAFDELTANSMVVTNVSKVSLTTSPQSVVSVSIYYLKNISLSGISDRQTTGYDKLSVRLIFKPFQMLRFSMLAASYFTDDGEETHLLSTSLNYHIGKKLKLGIEGKNLLNRNDFLLRNADNRAVTFSGLRLFPRYVILKLTFQF